MRLILNIIWLIFGGLWLALGYLLAALICFVLIITIPFGFAALRIASYALWPFGRTIVEKPGPRPGALIGNVIWVILFGIWLAIGHVISAVAMAITIIGIPLALANLKLIPVSLVPLGKEIVPVDQARSLTTCSGPPHDRHRHSACRRCSAPSGACPTDGPLVDTFGRVATDLRVSLTDRCNLRCTYCMPAEGLDWLPGEQLLTHRRADPAAAHRGHPARHHQRPVHRRRAVGGQAPRGRRRRHRRVAAAARNHVDHQRNWAATSGPPNSSRPGLTGSTSHSTPSTPHASPTSPAATGCTTCWPDSRPRKAAGLSPVKVNAVLDPVTGLDDAVALLRFCLDHGYQLRIIEQMPLDAGHEWKRGTGHRRRRRAGRPAAVTSMLTTGPGAARFGARAAVAGRRRAAATVGIIASVSHAFCSACDRTRLTADGQVRNCLFAREETDLRRLMRAGADDDALEAAWRAAMWAKAAGHGINDPDFVQPDRPMSAIGG